MREIHAAIFGRLRAFLVRALAHWCGPTGRLGCPVMQSVYSAVIFLFITGDRNVSAPPAPARCVLQCQTPKTWK
eukprot:2407035-Amphidinium_carterae.1